jgi:hypothetical protein
MKENEGKWCCSQCDEYWSPVEYFETKNEAIAAGKIEFDGDGFFVGQISVPTLTAGIDMGLFIDNMIDDNEDSLGDWSDIWIGDIPDIQDLLDQKMNEIISHDKIKNIFDIENAYAVRWKATVSF